jgi:hypothetical protein
MGMRNRHVCCLHNLVYLNAWMKLLFNHVTLAKRNVVKRTAMFYTAPVLWEQYFTTKDGVGANLISFPSLHYVVLLPSLYTHPLLINRIMSWFFNINYQGRVSCTGQVTQLSIVVNWSRDLGFESASQICWVWSSKFLSSRYRRRG